MGERNTVVIFDVPGDPRAVLERFRAYAGHDMVEKLLEKLSKAERREDISELLKDISDDLLGLMARIFAFINADPVGTYPSIPAITYTPMYTVAGIARIAYATLQESARRIYERYYNDPATLARMMSMLTQLGSMLLVAASLITTLYVTRATTAVAPLPWWPKHVSAGTFGKGADVIPNVSPIAGGEEEEKK